MKLTLVHPDCYEQYNAQVTSVRGVIATDVRTKFRVAFRIMADMNRPGSDASADLNEVEIGFILDDAVHSGEESC